MADHACDQFGAASLISSLSLVESSTLRISFSPLPSLPRSRPSMLFALSATAPPRLLGLHRHWVGSTTHHAQGTATWLR